MTLGIGLIIIWCLVSTAWWIKLGLSVALIVVAACEWGLRRVWDNSYWAGFSDELIGQIYERVFRHYERFLKNGSIVTHRGRPFASLN